MPGTCGKYRTGTVLEVGVQVMKWQAKSLVCGAHAGIEIIHKQTNGCKCRDNLDSEEEKHRK